MIKTEMIEYAIEDAIKPGDFIGYNEGWSFISGLEKVKEQIDGVANKQPLQAVDLIETFIAVCYEKAEEIDDSSGSFGMLVEELFCSWVNARQKGKCDPRETVNHARKYSFIPGFKQVVAGKGPSTEQSIIERAKMRWRK